MKPRTMDGSSFIQALRDSDLGVAQVLKNEPELAGVIAGAFIAGKRCREVELAGIDPFSMLPRLWRGN